MNLNCVIDDRHPVVIAIDTATAKTIPNPMNFLYVPPFEGSSLGNVNTDKAALVNKPNKPFGKIVSLCHSKLFPRMYDSTVIITVIPITPVAIKIPKTFVF